MSGLCGWLGWTAGTTEADATLARMADRLTCRPGETTTRLGGRRSGLAIVARGAGELVEDGSLRVAVVGSPYFPDTPLAAEAALHGTAKTFARLYREAGAGAVERLAGGFAVAVVDDRALEGLLAIDRIGGRFPLVYKATRSGLVFGSSGDAVAGHPEGRAEVDPQGVFNYLYFHVVPGAATVRRDVRRLLPGGYVRYRAGRFEVGRYWQPRYREDGKASLRELEEEFHRLLRVGVRRATAGKSGSVGCFLSGGTDSSTVAGLVGELTGESTPTYSIGFDAQGFDEMEYATAAATHFRTDQHVYYVTPKDVLDAIPRIAAAYSDPFGNSSAVAVYRCARVAAERGTACLLAGDGGDELFAGNERYVQQRVLGLYEHVPRLVRQWVIEPLVFRLPVAGSWPVRKARGYIQQAGLPMPQRLERYNLLARLGVDQVIEPEFLRSVDTGEPQELLSEFYRGASADSLLNRMLALDLQITLADNDLPKVSRMCQIAGVSAGYPLLDDELVEFSLRLPSRLKLRGLKLRWFWKHALRDFLPRKVLTKRKHGFGLPFGVWLRENAELKAFAHDSLDRFSARGVVRAKFLKEILHRHAVEHASYYGELIWILMMLEQWLRLHIDGEAVANQPGSNGG